MTLTFLMFFFLNLWPFSLIYFPFVKKERERERSFHFWAIISPLYCFKCTSEISDVRFLRGPLELPQGRNTGVGQLRITEQSLSYPCSCFLHCRLVCPFSCSCLCLRGNWCSLGPQDIPGPSWQSLRARSRLSESIMDAFESHHLCFVFRPSGFNHKGIWAHLSTNLYLLSIFYVLTIVLRSGYRTRKITWFISSWSLCSNYKVICDSTVVFSYVLSFDEMS